MSTEWMPDSCLHAVRHFQLGQNASQQPSMGILGACLQACMEALTQFRNVASTAESPSCLLDQLCLVCRCLLPLHLPATLRRLPGRDLQVPKCTLHSMLLLPLARLTGHAHTRASPAKSVSAVTLQVF